MTVLVAFAAAAISAWAISQYARGIGVVEGGSFAGAHFDFQVQAPESHGNPNRFLFYDHGMFIPVDIVVPHPGRPSFSGNQVSFVGAGTYNGTTPVTVFVTASDGGRGAPDSFSMTARNAGGTIVHSANGNVIEGDIVIGVGR